MKFNKVVAVIAIFSFAAQVNAAAVQEQPNGMTTVASDTVSVESDAVTTTPQQEVVVPTNAAVVTEPTAPAVTTAPATAAPVTTAPVTSAQPNTVVEAAPVSESRAEVMRKARQSEEVKTEQKLVEKLEALRLQEERQRAERILGNSGQPAAATAPTAAPAPAPQVVAPVVAPVVVPVVAEPKKEEPAQVTIEKVEIVQPKEEEKAPVEKAESAAAVNAMKVEDQEHKEEKGQDKFFVGGLLGAVNYNASNVKSNYGLGVSVGMNLATNWVIEGSFLYSNHSIDTYWQYPLYRELDQYDFGITAKYYLLSGKLKPFVGGSAIYIYRKYQSRSQFGDYWNVNSSTSEESSNALNGGLTAGVDFAINDKFLIGGGIDYNFNVMNKQDFRSQYSIPTNVKQIEEIEYTVIKVNVKMTF